MDIINLILWPLKWAIELVLVSFHWLFAAMGMDSNAGLTWILSIIGLVIVVRAALIPLFVRQIKAQRKALEIAPQIKKIQDKYKGKNDQFSREAMTRETMDLYKRTGSSPFASCFPLLVQMPIFGALFTVLSSAQNNHAGVGLLDVSLAASFANAQILGAPMKETLIQAVNNGGPWQVIVVAVTMVALMTITQFITQRQIVSKNMSAETKASPAYRQQQILLWVLPFLFIFSGVAFPVGLMFYWLISNFWTMGQQFVVIRNMPNPGSDAALAREARLARRGKLVAPGLAEPAESPGTPATPARTQRSQPVSRTRARKKK